MTLSKLLSCVFCVLILSVNTAFTQQLKLVLPIGHTDKIYDAQFSPDGKKFITCGDITAKLWDVPTGELLANLEGHKQGIYATLISPDNKRIITASSDETARLWESSTGTTLSIMNVMCGNIPDYIPVFSPDGKLIMNIANNTYMENFSITCYRAEEGDSIAVIQNPDGEIERAFFTTDSKRIVIFSKINNPKIWDVASGKLLDSLVGFDTSAYARFYAGDGQKMATFSNNGKSVIWNISTGKALASLQEPALEITSTLFSRNGKIMVTLTDNGIAKAWDAVTGKQVSRLDGLSGRITSVSLSAGGEKLATCTDEHFVRTWNLRSGKLLSVTEHSNTNAERYNKIKSVSFSPDGKMLITIKISGAVNEKSHGMNIWDVNSGKSLYSFDKSKIYGSPSSVTFSPDGKKILVAHNEPDILIYTATVLEASSGKPLVTIKSHTYEPELLVFSPDGSKLITTQSRPDNNAKVWDLSSGKFLFNIAHMNHGRVAPDRINSVLFSPDSKKFITNKSNIWEAETGNIIRVLANNSVVNLGIGSTAFSPDGNKIVVTTNSDSTVIQDAATGNALATLNGSLQNSSPAIFSYNARRIITGIEPLSSLQIRRESDDTLRKTKIWNAGDGRYIATFDGYTYNFSDPVFSSDGKMAAFVNDAKISTYYYEDFTGKTSTSIDDSIFTMPPGNIFPMSTEENPRFAISIWDVNTGKRIADTKWHQGHIYSFDFSLDGKTIVAAVSDSTLLIWNTENGDRIKKIDNAPDLVYGAVFSHDGEKITAVSGRNKAKVWDAKTGIVLNDTPSYSNDVLQTFFSPYESPKKPAGDANLTEVRFSNDDTRILTTDSDKKTRIWNATDGSLIAQADWNDDRVVTLEYSPDRNSVATTIADFTVKMWEATSGKYVYTFLALDSTGYINRVSDGYYQGSRGAVKLLHYVTKDLKIISFEQLDVKYNRPDKVLEAINKTDTALLNVYRNAYYKRIKKLGIDTTAFRDGYSVPEADFVNRDAISPEQNKEALSLRIKGTDKDYKLDRINVWVNEVPVFGQRGFSLRRDNINSVDKTITVKLSQGENRIETSITNVNGTESYRMPLMVNYKPAQAPKEKIYFIGIGIDRFADADYNLKYSVKDIRDLTIKLKAKFGNDIIVDTLFNEQVAVENIKALKQKLLKSSVNDKVIVSYSGHGLLSKALDYYLSTYNVKFEEPELNGLPYDELENILDSIPARRKLMLIDACHSGEVDKDEFQQVQVNKELLAVNHVVSRGVKVTNTDTSTRKIGLQNSFELMQNLFVNVGKSTGAIIISAAAGTEFALEFGGLKNGVFTYSLMEAMDKYPGMKISELKKIVGTRVEQLTNGMQKPTSRNETIAVDWNIW